MARIAVVVVAALAVAFPAVAIPLVVEPSVGRVLASASVAVALVASVLTLWAARADTQRPRTAAHPRDRIRRGGPAGLDVTERHQAEEALRASGDRFGDVFRHAPIGMVLVSPAGVFLAANQAISAMIGYTEEELVGRPVWEFLHPDDVADARRDAAATVAGTLTRFAAERRYRHRDGRDVWVQVHTTLERGPDGTPRHFIAQVVDVTERRANDQALRASEARYRGLIESQDELVVRFDPAQRITFANDAYCRHFGVTREQVAGREFWPIVHPDDVARVHESIEEVRIPPYRTSIESRTRTPRGWRWVAWDASAIRNQNGEVVEYQAAGRDVTERRAADDALRASLEQLRRNEEQLRLLARHQAAIREEERKRLGFDLHDDVCQEMVGIGILLESVRRRLGPVGADVAADLDRVERYLREVAEHIRLLAGELRPILLHDLGLEGSLRSLAGGLTTAATTVQAVFPAPIPRLDETLELTVYRIAQEALANAMRHARARSVQLTLTARERHLRLEVRDDGCGFDPAQRREQALGLMSMEERALAMGGRLELDSGPGRGTTVRLDCPLAERAPASAA